MPNTSVYSSQSDKVQITPTDSTEKSAYTIHPSRFLNL
jgi:hypothetical protein